MRIERFKSCKESHEIGGKNTRTLGSLEEVELDNLKPEDKYSSTVLCGDIVVI